MGQRGSKKKLGLSFRSNKKSTVRIPASPTPKKSFLFIGSRLSGKTTLAKHIRLLWGGEVSSKEMSDYQHTIFETIVSSIQVLVIAHISNWDKNSKLEMWSSTDNKKFAEELITQDLHWNLELGEKIKKLWKTEPKLKEMYAYRHMIYFPAPQGIELLENFASATRSQPNNAMILKGRNKTIGFKKDILNIPFRDTSHYIEVVDSGGGIEEQKQWNEKIKLTDAIFFTVSLASYNETNRETHNNVMTESLESFKQIINSDAIHDKKFFLLFTKKDLFMEKIQYTDIRAAFPDIPKSLKFTTPVMNLTPTGAPSSVAQLESEHIHRTRAGGFRKRQLSVFVRRDNTNIEIDIPDKVWNQICSYMDAISLCNLGATSYSLYELAGSDEIWKKLCLAYQKNIDEKHVDMVYKRYQVPEKEENGRQIAKNKWKYYYELGGGILIKSLDYILNAFYNAVNNEDLRKAVQENSFVLNTLDDRDVKRCMQQSMESIFEREPITS
jgi:hypothetical protein